MSTLSEEHVEWTHLGQTEAEWLMTYMEHGLKDVVMSTLSQEHVKWTHLGQTEAEWLIIAVTDVTANTLKVLPHVATYYTICNTVNFYRVKILENPSSVACQNNSFGKDQVHRRRQRVDESTGTLWRINRIQKVSFQVMLNGNCY